MNNHLMNGWGECWELGFLMDGSTDFARESFVVLHYVTCMVYNKRDMPDLLPMTLREVWI